MGQDWNVDYRSKIRPAILHLAHPRVKTSSRSVLIISTSAYDGNFADAVSCDLTDQAYNVVICLGMESSFASAILLKSSAEMNLAAKHVTAYPYV
jgi:hypothetical protein